MSRAEEVKDALRDILAEKLDVGDPTLDLTHTAAAWCWSSASTAWARPRPSASWPTGCKSEGKKVLLCAGDTFRAAAADQLEIWAERAGVDIVRQHEGADPGAVLFDALQAAKARDVDVVLCDTAGPAAQQAEPDERAGQALARSSTGSAPDAARETLLVLDATTGQNGLIQARTVQGDGGAYRHRPHQAGRHRQGRHRHRHRPGAAACR